MNVDLNHNTHRLSFYARYNCGCYEISQRPLKAKIWVKVISYCHFRIQKLILDIATHIGFNDMKLDLHTLPVFSFW